MISAPTSPEGRIEFRARPAGVAVYVAPSGVRWQVFDCVLRNHWLERVYLEADIATHRVFVGPSGKPEVYRRRRRETFELSPAACARQLSLAHRLADSMNFDPSERITRMSDATGASPNEPSRR